MIYYGQLDNLFASEFPTTVQKAVDIIMGFLNDKQKAFIQRQESNQQLNYLYNDSLGLALDRALMRRRPPDATMLDTTNGKKVFVKDATNLIIDMLRKELRNHHVKIGKL